MTDLHQAVSQVAAHPRLFIKPGGVSHLRDLAKADRQAVLISKALIHRAEELLETPPVTRKLQGRRLLHVSREALDRLATLSMAWHLTGRQSFVDRAVIELRAVAAFENWNPSHFLDTAEMTMAVAIAYDWLHDQLDPEALAIARTAILEKGLRPALASEHYWWMTTDNNWNQVCHGGLVAGALVMLEHEREASLRILERAVRYLPNAMASYAPLGAYPEGPSYWSYGTTYNVMLLAMLDSALGSTFGLEKLDGFSQTGAFPILMTGPSGQMFNFSDGRTPRAVQPAVFWLAQKFSQPGWMAHENRLMEKSMPIQQGTFGRWPMPLALLWRDGSSASAALELPLHWTSHSKVPISVHRESWDQPDAAFVGLKAGSPSASHGHMDIGSFVFDVGGIRWAYDLGMENYHQVESRGMSLFKKAQDSDRWKVFRNHNLSHNTLVIDGQLQHAAGDAPMVRFSDDSAFPHSVVDMSPVYHGQVQQAHRGVALLPGGAMLVRDHLTGLKPGAEVRWAMVTHAEVGETGGPLLKLREGDQMLVLQIHGATRQHWQADDISTPRNEWDSPNEGTSMVFINAIAPESGTLDFTIVMHLASRPPPKLEIIHLAQPLDWSAANR